VEMKAVTVGRKEDKVVLMIGGAEVFFDYKAALRLAASLDFHGKAVKRWVGDVGTEFNVFADLTDANADELEAQKRRDPTAALRVVE